MRHKDRGSFDGHHRDRPGSGEGREGRPGGRGRAQRGDVRTAIMLVLAEEPMHGYQIMQAVSEHTDGAWRPSPGAVYPTIAQLEVEGLVTVQEDGGRRLVSLTADGRTYLADRTARRGDPFAEFAASAPDPARDLTGAFDALHAAAQQITTSGSPEQFAAAERALAHTRRTLYLILADEAVEGGI